MTLATQSRTPSTTSRCLNILLKICWRRRHKGKPAHSIMTELMKAVGEEICQDSEGL